jgi:hypothetical protein
VVAGVLNRQPVEARAVGAATDDRRAEADVRDQVLRVLRAGPVAVGIWTREVAVFVPRDLEDCKGTRRESQRGRATGEELG